MDETSDYTSIHQAFLQSLFSKSTLTFPSSKPLLAALLSAHHDRPILEGDITFQTFTTIIHTLNAALSPFAYEVRSMHDQRSGTRAPEEAVYALVNAQSDVMTSVATGFSADEIGFVRRVIDGMFEGNNSVGKEVMAVKLMDALRLAKAPNVRSQAQTQTQDGEEGGAASVTQGAGQVSSLTQDRAEKMIEQLVEEGWMERSGAGYISLSTRSLMELGRWLVETYNDPEEEEGEWKRIKMCEGCKQIVTVGQRCSNQECLCRLHDVCAEIFFRGQDNRRCPTCRSEWTGRDFVGERAVRGMASANGRPSQGGRRSGGR